MAKFAMSFNRMVALANGLNPGAKGGKDGRTPDRRPATAFCSVENCSTPEISRCIVTCSPGTMNNPG
jgi:hypothetical protein